MTKTPAIDPRRKDGRKDGRRTEGGLTPIEKRFVAAFTDPGKHTSGTDAYLDASPKCKTRKAASVGASRLLDRPQVQAAIEQALKRQRIRGKVIGTNQLIKLAEKANSEYVQADCSKFLVAEPDKQGASGGGQGLTININLGSGETLEAIDITPTDPQEG